MSTTDYTGRQIDLELLQSIQLPSFAAQRVQVANVTQTPKVVAGVEKAVQRYTQMLLTTVGDVHFNPLEGGYLVPTLFQGLVQDQGQLAHLFCVASSSAMQAINRDDQDATFGPIPDDELLQNAALTDMQFDYPSQTVSLTILLTTAAGESYNFVVPISTAP